LPGEIKGHGRPGGADREAGGRAPGPRGAGAPGAARGRPPGRAQDEGAEARRGRGARPQVRAAARDEGPRVEPRAGGHGARGEAGRDHGGARGPGDLRPSRQGAGPEPRARHRGRPAAGGLRAVGAPRGRARGDGEGPRIGGARAAGPPQPMISPTRGGGATGLEPTTIVRARIAWASARRSLSAAWTKQRGSPLRTRWPTFARPDTPTAGSIASSALARP